jgi:hypothetical protein
VPQTLALLVQHQRVQIAFCVIEETSFHFTRETIPGKIDQMQTRLTIGVVAESAVVRQRIVRKWWIALARASVEE